MPFRPDPFLKKFQRLRLLRQKPALGYLVALASVAAASIVKESFPDLLAGVRFAPYFLAVALTAVVGGGWPGLLSIIFSVVAANFLFPPDVVPESPAVAVANALFLTVAGVILMFIWLLNHAIDRIWHHAENVRLIVESQPAGVIGVDAEGRITLVNAAVEQQLGYSREELLDLPVDQLVPVEVRHQHLGHRETYMTHPEPRKMGAGRDLSAVAKDGSLLPVEIGLNPVSNGRHTGAIATIVDISERKTLEQRAQFLANEVSHRARNLLTVVQALALRKLPRESSAEFVSTLDALARTQKIFGTQTVAPLRPIIEGELAGFGAQITVTGCDVLLTPTAGQDLSLVIHELTTNAIKHGALSVPGGHVTIEGEIEGEDGAFVLVWTERRGPPITQKPSRAGFGQKVLQAIAKGLNAKMRLDYQPEGIRFELVAPIERISNVSELGSKPKEA